MIDVSAEVDAAIAAKRPGAEVRLQVLSGDRERRVSVTLGERPTVRAGADGVAEPRTGHRRAHGDHQGHGVHARRQAAGVGAATTRSSASGTGRAGKTVRTIRGQVGPGPRRQDLRHGAVARWPLAGGRRFMAPGFGVRDDAVGDIRLYDFATGKLVALLQGAWQRRQRARLLARRQAADLGRRLTALGHHLGRREPQAAAPAEGAQGRHLCRGLHAGRRARRDWQRRHHAEACGRVSDGKEIADAHGAQKDKDRALAVRPSDGTIASGERRRRDPALGRQDRALPAHARPRRARRSARSTSRPTARGWSRPARKAACRLRSSTSGTWRPAKRWRTYGKHDNIVLAAAISPDGRLVATGGGNNNEIHVWDVQTGETRHVLGGTGTPAWAVGFSADGQRIAWGTHLELRQSSTSAARSSLQLRLPTPDAGLGRPEPLDATPPRRSCAPARRTGAYALAHREGGAYGYDAILDMKKDGKTVAVHRARSRPTATGHRSYTFTPDGQTIISGGERRPHRLRPEGQADRRLHRPRGRRVGGGAVSPTAACWSRAAPTRPCGCGTSRRAS